MHRLGLDHSEENQINRSGIHRIETLACVILIGSDILDRSITKFILLKNKNLPTKYEGNQST